MENIFIVKAVTAEKNGKRVSTIQYSSEVDHQEVREFFLRGEHVDDTKYITDRVDEFLAGERKDCYIAGAAKYAVRCEVQRNEMLQIYEIVKTIKES